jgi:uncharacterized phiE125 gp8 family phage protein
MRVFVVTPPAPVVTWEDADAHLHLDGDTDQRDEVEAMIAAATAALDGPTGWLGRALGEQVLEARIDNFGCGSIVLPYPPVVEIVSVNYIDRDGVEQTIDTDHYEILGTSLVPAYDVTWPAPRYQREAIRIRYRAGYPVGGTEEAPVVTLPKTVRAAILLMVGDLYRRRDTTTDVVSFSVPMSTTVENLLSPLRVWR